jgi:hypothetical protein
MAPFVSAPFDRSRTPKEPALPSRVTPDAAASTASRPASLTIRIRPSVGQDGEENASDLGWGQEKFRKIGNFGRGCDYLGPLAIALWVIEWYITSDGVAA